MKGSGRIFYPQALNKLLIIALNGREMQDGQAWHRNLDNNCRGNLLFLPLY
jgi:hypothetical protein